MKMFPLLLVSVAKMQGLPVYRGPLYTNLEREWCESLYRPTPFNSQLVEEGGTITRYKEQCFGLGASEGVKRFDNPASLRPFQSGSINRKNGTKVMLEFNSKLSIITDVVGRVEIIVRIRPWLEWKVDFLVTNPKRMSIFGQTITIQITRMDRVSNVLTILQIKSHSSLVVVIVKTVRRKSCFFLIINFLLETALKNVTISWLKY